MTDPQILVLVPVFNRPANAARVAASLKASRADARLMFLCSPGDDPEIAACRKTGCETLVMPFRQARGDFARKINYGYRHSEEPFLLMGADDIVFHRTWDRWLLLEAADDRLGVVGTDDLANPEVKAGGFSTHPLIRRAYADDPGTIDCPRAILCELYAHNFCDRELAETAMQRNAWSFCYRSKVEHLHPNFRRRQVVYDDTYGLGQRYFRQDQMLFARRRPLWGGRPNMRWRPPRRRARPARHA